MVRGYSVRLAPSSSTEGVLLVCTRFSEGVAAWVVSAGVLAEQAARGQRQGHQGRQGFLSNMHNWALLSVFRVRYVLAALEHKQPAFHRKQAAEAAHGM